MTIRNFFSKLFSFFKAQPVEQKPVEPPVKDKTSIVVFVGEQPVGAIQSVTISESRSPDNLATTVTGTAQRIRFDKQRVAEAFSRGFLHVNAQKYPLQIEIKTEGHPTTFIQNVWVTGLDWAYHTDNWIIVDEMKWEAELIKTKNS